MLPLNSKNNTTLFTILILIGITSCIPTSKVNKYFTLGYHVEPQSSFLLIWDSEKKYPLAKQIYNRIEPRFLSNGFSLINFHDYNTTDRLRQKGVFISESRLNIEQLGEVLGVQYILKAKLENIEDGYIFDHYLQREVTDYLSEGYISSSITLEVISVAQNQTINLYKAKASNIPFIIPNLDSSDESTISRAIDQAIKKFLKDAYPF